MLLLEIIQLVDSRVKIGSFFFIAVKVFTQPVISVVKILMLGKELENLKEKKKIAVNSL